MARRLIFQGYEIRQNLSDMCKLCLITMSKRAQYDTVGKHLKEEIIKWILSHPNVKPSCVSNNIVKVYNPVTNEKKKYQKC